MRITNGKRLIQFIIDNDVPNEYYDYYVDLKNGVYTVYWKSRPILRLSKNACSVCARRQERGWVRQTIEDLLNTFVATITTCSVYNGFEATTPDNITILCRNNLWSLFKRSPEHCSRYPLFSEYAADVSGDVLTQEEYLIPFFKAFYKQLPDTKFSRGNFGYWKCQKEAFFYYNKSQVAHLKDDTFELTILRYNDDKHTSRIELRNYYDHLIRQFALYHKSHWKSRRLWLRANTKNGMEKREMILCLPGDKIKIKAKIKKRTIDNI